MPVDEKLYRQEVEELTALVKDEWDDLRHVLTEAKFDLNKTLLVAFMEDEESKEFGVFVTADKKVFEYERSTETTDDNNIKINEITGNNDARNMYPQIEVALKMIDEGRFK